MTPPVSHVVSYVTGGYAELFKNIKKPSRLKVKPYGRYTNDEGCFMPEKNMSILAGRYKFEDIIGSGQSSVLIKAEDNFAKDKLVSIKVLHLHYSQLGTQEADCVRRLNQADPLDVSGTVRLLTTFSFDGHYCMVFELLSSKSLLQYTLHEDVECLSKLRNITLHMLKPLAFLEKHNIIHADLKPENLLFKRENDMTSLKLVDFGNALRCVYEELSLYYDDFELQTLLYRAPEVIFGLEFDTQVDMWSLGCIVAELYLGKPLFYGTDKLAVLNKMVKLLGPVPQSICDRGKFYEQLNDFSSDSAQPDATNVLVDKLFIRDYRLASFISKCLRYDPAERMTVAQAATHPFLAEFGISLFASGSAKDIQRACDMIPTPEVYSNRPEVENKACLRLLSVEVLRTGGTGDYLSRYTENQKPSYPILVKPRNRIRDSDTQPNRMRALRILEQCPKTTTQHDDVPETNHQQPTTSAKYTNNHASGDKLHQHQASSNKLQNQNADCPTDNIKKRRKNSAHSSNQCNVHSDKALVCKGQNERDVPEGRFERDTKYNVAVEIKEEKFDPKESFDIHKFRNSNIGSTYNTRLNISRVSNGQHNPEIDLRVKLEPNKEEESENETYHENLSTERSRSTSRVDPRDRRNSNAHQSRKNQLENNVERKREHVYSSEGNSTSESHRIVGSDRVPKTALKGSLRTHSRDYSTDDDDIDSAPRSRHSRSKRKRRKEHTSPESNQNNSSNQSDNPLPSYPPSIFQGDHNDETGVEYRKESNKSKTGIHHREDHSQNPQRDSDNKRVTKCSKSALSHEDPNTTFTIEPIKGAALTDIVDPMAENYTSDSVHQTEEYKNTHVSDHESNSSEISDVVLISVEPEILASRKKGNGSTQATCQKIPSYHGNSDRQLSKSIGNEQYMRYLNNLQKNDEVKGTNVDCESGDIVKNKELKDNAKSAKEQESRFKMHRPTSSTQEETNNTKHSTANSYTMTKEVGETAMYQHGKSQVKEEATEIFSPSNVLCRQPLKSSQVKPKAKLSTDKQNSNKMKAEPLNKKHSRKRNLQSNCDEKSTRHIIDNSPPSFRKRAKQGTNLSKREQSSEARPSKSTIHQSNSEARAPDLSSSSRNTDIRVESRISLKKQRRDIRPQQVKRIDSAFNFLISDDSCDSDASGKICYRYKQAK